jgi:hypothetical protein
MDDEHSLYMMVGEIRSDVKTLLTRSAKDDTRITSLERFRWWQGGIGAAAVFLAAKLGFQSLH